MKVIIKLYDRGKRKIKVNFLSHRCRKKLGTIKEIIHFPKHFDSIIFEI